MTGNYTPTNLKNVSLDSPRLKSSKNAAYFYCTSSNDKDINYLLSAGGVFCRREYENLKLACPGGFLKGTDRSKVFFHSVQPR